VTKIEKMKTSIGVTHEWLNGVSSIFDEMIENIFHVYENSSILTFNMGS
jgi:hypothetical protein